MLPDYPPAAAGRGSYRYCLGEHGLAELLRQGLGCKHIHGHAQQLQQLVPDRTDVQQGCFRGGVDEQIQIAIFGIATMNHRPENPRVAGTMNLHHPADGFTVRGKG